MVGHRVVWGEFAFLLALALIGFIHDASILDVDVLYPVLLLIALFYFFHWLSPITLLMGERSVPYDIIAVLGFGLLAGGRLFGIVAAESATLIAGTIILIFLAAHAVRHHTIRSPSIMHAFKQRAKHHQALFLLALFVLFFVLVFGPIVSWSLLIEDVPFIRPIGAVLFIALLAQEQRFVRSSLLAKMLHLLADLGKHARRLFTDRKTFLLGVAGILVLQFTIHISRTLIPALIGGLSALSGASLLAGILSAFGTVCLFVLPGYLWVKLCLVRQNDEHLPNWRSGTIALVSAGVFASALAPIVSLTHFPPGARAYAIGLVEVARLSDPFIALVGAALVATLVLGVARLDDYLRKVLMMGPFIAGVAFLGLYAYESFVHAFLSALAMVLAFTVTWYVAALPIAFAIFIAQVLFIVMSYLSFLYEMWRD